jgi:hypothetical protein
LKQVAPIVYRILKSKDAEMEALAEFKQRLSIKSGNESTSFHTLQKELDDAWRDSPGHLQALYAKEPDATYQRVQTEISGMRGFSMATKVFVELRGL